MKKLKKIVYNSDGEKSEKMALTKDCKRPPLGSQHRKIHVEERLRVVSNVIKRYLEIEKSIPIEWIEECKSLIEYLKTK